MKVNYVKKLNEMSRPAGTEEAEAAEAAEGAEVSSVEVTAAGGAEAEDTPVEEPVADAGAPEAETVATADETGQEATGESGEVGVDGAQEPTPPAESGDQAVEDTD